MENCEVLFQRPRNHSLRFIANDNFKIRLIPSFTIYPPDYIIVTRYFLYIYANEYKKGNYRAIAGGFALYMVH